MNLFELERTDFFWIDVEYSFLLLNFFFELIEIETNEIFENFFDCVDAGVFLTLF